MKNSRCGNCGSLDIPPYFMEDKMIKKEFTDFDIRQIALSGQCFRLRPLSEYTFSLTALGRYLEISQQGAETVFSCTEQEWKDVWENYFDLHTDYAGIKKAIDPEDFYLQEAARIGGGIRILRQELWETIVTFIISQQNNIPRIQKCVDALCGEFGSEAENFHGNAYRLFPGPEAVASATEERLREMGLGYRAPYIVKTARMVCEKEVDLDRLPALGYEEAKAELLKLCGVGTKVADCICLFALHHIEAFPIDTHIKAMLKRYPEGFPFERYQGFAGVLQQYAFYYELHGQKGAE